MFLNLVILKLPVTLRDISQVRDKVVCSIFLWDIVNKQCGIISLFLVYEGDRLEVGIFVVRSYKVFT